MSFDDPINNTAASVTPIPLLRVFAVDTTTDETLFEVLPDQPIDGRRIDGLQVSFYALVNDDHPDASTVKSVRVLLNGEEAAFAIQNTAPYALFGDRSGDFLGGMSLGTDPFTLTFEAYSARNATGDLLGSVGGTFRATAANVAPEAVADLATTDEDTSVTINVLANDVDTDGDVLTLSLIGQPSFGTVVDNGDGTVTYTAAPGANGTDHFTYTLTDGRATSTATVTVTVDPVNDRPVIDNLDLTSHTSIAPITVSEATAPGTVIGQMLASDPDGDALTFSAVNSDGTFLVDGATGDIRIAPDAVLDYATQSSHSLTVSVSDGTDSTLVDVHVMLEDVIPLLRVYLVDTTTDETLTEIVPNQPITGRLLQDRLVAIYAVPNPDNPDSDAIKAAELSVNGSPFKRETVSPYALFGDKGGDFLGGLSLTGDTVTIEILAYNGRGNLAQVIETFGGEFEVSPTNVAPELQDDAVALDEDTSLTFDVTVNDFDGDGDALTVVNVSPTTLGDVVINADGTLTYTPDADANGTDTFTYTVTDGYVTKQASVTVTVDPVNDAPVLVNVDPATGRMPTFTISEDAAPGTVIGRVIASDPDGDTLRFAYVYGDEDGNIIVDPDTGEIKIAEGGALDYEWYNSYDIAVAIEDGTTTRVVNVPITVTNVVEPPLLRIFAVDTATDETLFEIEQGEEVPFRVLEISGREIDGRTISFYAEPNPDHPQSDTIGSVRVLLNGQEEAFATQNVAPYALFGDTRGDFLEGRVFPEGDFTLEFEAYSGRNGNGTLIDVVGGDFRVVAVDAPPTPIQDYVETPEDTPIEIDVLANDFDFYGQPFWISGWEDPDDGNVVLTDDGTLLYTPDPDANGFDGFSYTVTNGLTSADSWVVMRVLEVNDAPMVSDSLVAFRADMPAGTSVASVTATDVEGDVLSYVITDGDPDNLFTIDAATGEITIAEGAAFSQEAVAGVVDHTLTVTVDDGTDTVEAKVYVDVEAPCAKTGAPSCSCEQDAHDGHDHHNAQMLSLVPLDDVTHVAAQDGSWFDPATWLNGEVPGDGAKVQISGGVTVSYDGLSDAVLSTIRVDGALEFPSDTDTALSVDTIVVTSSGSFSMGSADAPVTADAVITFVNADGTLDAGQIGLGLVSLPGASTQIYGAEKTTRVEVNGNQLAGDTLIEIKGGVPADWAIGDVLVLAGTQKDLDGSMEDNTRFQDEELEITGLTADGVTFTNLDTGETSLRFDHTLPEGFEGQLDMHMVNMTRSITFQSQDGKDTALMDRGHIMVHDHDSVFQNTALVGLGRTDKATVLDPFDTTMEINGQMLSVEGEGTNIGGRYALHVHRPFDHGDDGGAVDFSGNAVWDSPGWGIVLHGARGYIDNNVVFDTVGAGIISEDGDEVGYFRDNTVIKVASGTNGDDFPLDIVRKDLVIDGDTSNNPKTVPFDIGFHGSGFWFDSAYSVREATGNVTASTAHAGMFFYGTNDDEFGRFANPASAPVELLKYMQDGIIDPFSVPVGVVEDNQIYNGQYGLFLAGLTRDDFREGGFTTGGQSKGLEHFDESEFRDIEIWNVTDSGIFTAYSTNFLFEDMLILGNPDDPNDKEDARGHDAGILIHKLLRNLEIDDVHIEGFHTGVKVGQGGDQGYHDLDALETYVYGDMTIFNTIENFSPSHGRTGPGPGENPGMMDNPPFNYYAQLVGEITVDTSASAFDPIAMGTATQIGAFSYWLDADGSHDPDYQQDAQFPDRPVIENTIAFFQWDLDNDGAVDAFGRDLPVHFAPGTVPDFVTLTVTDAQGVQVSTQVALEDGTGQTRNAVLDSGFDTDLAPKINQFAFYDVLGYSFRPWGQGTSNRNNPEAWENAGGFAEFVNFHPSKDKEGNIILNEDGSIKDPNDVDQDGTLDQLITNRGEHRGTDTFVFDLAYTQGNDSADAFMVQVYGINGRPVVSHLHGPRQLYDMEPFDAVLLHETGNLLSKGSFDWTPFSAEIDFQDGYDYLYLRFRAEDMDQVDWLAVDNVTLGGMSYGEDLM